jgi:hypothetical protein
VKIWLKIMCSWKLVGKKTPFFPSFFMAWKLKDHFSYVNQLSFYSRTKVLYSIFWSINGICKLVRNQNYVIFVFLHQLLKKFHQIIILLHVFFITLFIYSLSFVFHLFAIGSCLIYAPLLLKSVDSWCFIHHHLRGWQWWVVLCQYCLYWSHVFFCKRKKGKFRNIKIKRNSFHNFGNYCYKLAKIIQDFRKPCTLKECNQILNRYGF